MKAQVEETGHAIVRADGTEEATFHYDFALESKSLQADVDENGDLWIEGYASDFGVDRQDEAFEPGAFEKGLKAFLATNPIMLYHHQYDKALGQFTDARVDENGLWVRGRVDKPSEDNGWGATDIFNKIRKGTIKAFSVGGIFRRRHTKAGPRIYDCDLGEISITPFPVNPRTTFSVVAAKAFSNIEGKAEGDTVVAEVIDETQPLTEPDKQTQETGTPAEEAPDRQEEEDAQKEAAKKAEADKLVLEPGSITSDHIATESIKTEHLHPDLRSRFAVLKEDEGPTLDDLGEALTKFEQSMNELAHHVGYAPGDESGPKPVTHPGNVRS